MSGNKDQAQFADPAVVLIIAAAVAAWLLSVPVLRIWGIWGAL